MSSETVMVLFMASLIGGLYFILFLLYQKLSGAIDCVRKQSLKQSDNVFAQIEALLALYVELRPIHGLPPTRGWAASPDFLRLLVKYMLESRPENVVECSSGVSTLVLAASLRAQGKGHVFSLEHEPEYAAKTRELIALHGLTDWATILDAPLTELSLPDWKGKWYDFSGIPNEIAIDMLVIDGPPHRTAAMARYPALPVLKNKLRPGSIVLLDDADRADENSAIKRWLADLDCFSVIDGLTAEKGVACLRKHFEGGAITEKRLGGA